MNIKTILTDKKFFPVFIVIICAIILLVMFDSAPNSQTQEEESADPALSLESRLERVLSKVSGAGKVSVFVSLEDFGSTDYAKDKKEVSRESETELEQTTVMEGSGSTASPVIEKMFTPKVKGIIVVSEGASDLSVKENLSRAVEASLAIMPHRIAVLLGNN